jgi:hypothetical protein
MEKTGGIILLSLMLFFSSLVVAEYSIDISGLKTGEYTIGEEVKFQVILLDEDIPVEKEITVSLYDALKKKEVIKSITSNSPSSITIGQDFPSGIWNIKAQYEEVFVERTITVGANLDVEFEIINDELIIRNKGNIRYTKTVQITIGSSTNSYVQNIGVGEEKILKLVSAQGTYNIKVTDGTKTLNRENVQLYGTGNVIGAVDRDLVDYTGLASVGDAAGKEGRFVSLNKLPLAITFVAGVLILGALVAIERKISRKKKHGY